MTVQTVEQRKSCGGSGYSTGPAESDPRIEIDIPCPGCPDCYDPTIHGPQGLSDLSAEEFGRLMGLDFWIFESTLYWLEPVHHDGQRYRSATGAERALWEKLRERADEAVPA